MPRERKEIHTSGNRKSGYKNTVNKKIVGTHSTKKAAKEAAKEWAKEQEAEHIIHSEDGKIQEANSYGNDPCPPKDKK